MTIGMTLILILMSRILGLGSMPRLTTGPIEVTKATRSIIAALIVVAAMGPSLVGALIAVSAVAWASRRSDSYRAPSCPLYSHAMLRRPENALTLTALGLFGPGSPPLSPELGVIQADALPYTARAPLAVLDPAVSPTLMSVLRVSLATLMRR